jgi:hypothetical protein
MLDHMYLRHSQRRIDVKEIIDIKKVEEYANILT